MTYGQRRGIANVALIQLEWNRKEDQHAELNLLKTIVKKKDIHLLKKQNNSKSQFSEFYTILNYKIISSNMVTSSSEVLKRILDKFKQQKS